MPPVGARYSGEPHVFVSADTRQKASFVNSLGAKRKTLRGITNHEHRESSYLRAYKAPLHLSRTLYKSAAFYAKQTQFPKKSNERKLTNNN